MDDALAPSDFPQFFRELNSREPFPWQIRLAERVCREGWPRVIDLPTASGKTACIDIALFALVAAANAPRRIFFVVDRRVVVNEAAVRARRIRERLLAGDGILGKVAGRLRKLAGSADGAPLEVVELRGGIYRDTSWVRNPLQPMVVVSTVDQVGSRLLFRGYGVSSSTWPIHAALIANDSLIILDEAHCARAFSQTLAAIEKFRSDEWAERPLGLPFSFVQMTATPIEESTSEPFRIGTEDRLPENLGPRIYAKKPTSLVESAKPGIAETLKHQVLKLSDDAGEIRGAAVIVNRVATARETWKLLQAAGKRVELILGRMRPLDRDDQLARLEPLKSGAPREEAEETVFVVSTQCIEVGADLDFDVLVSECASVDALLQRFGRLDRLGEFKGALGAVVIAAGQATPKKPDPVYGEALSKTWLWLQQAGGENKTLNFGIEAQDDQRPTVVQLLKGVTKERADEMRRFGPDGAVLLPAHLDVFAQTSPEPFPKPEPTLYLHGPEDRAQDVQVVWRADLNCEPASLWPQIVALCPPVSAECMPVPISEVRRWLEEPDGAGDPTASDIESQEELETRAESGQRPVLLWAGTQSAVTTRLADIRPGSTVVAPTAYGGWDVIGHKPAGSAEDLAERATLQVRRKVSLRLHPQVFMGWPQTEALSQLSDQIQQEDLSVRVACKLLTQYLEELSTPDADPPPWLWEALKNVRDAPKRSMRLRPYPSDNEDSQRRKAWLLESRARVDADESLSEDTGEDESSEGLPVTLERHTQDVRTAARDLAGTLLGDEFASIFDWAAIWHDAGKVDIRFQARLLAGDLMAAQFMPEPLAKGSSNPWVEMSGSCGLPKGFRHELISLQLAEGSKPQLDTDPDLALHLIASHHGRCRAMAPVVLDPSGEELFYHGSRVSQDDRMRRAAHQLDSGTVERFWKLNRRYGWWGLAYLEALFRVSDWMASERRNRKEANRE